MAARGEPILEVRNLVRRFGGLTAIDGLSFAVYPTSVHGLIGPNGAGKTTTFNVISGFYAPSSGHVLYQGEDVSGRKTSALAEIGLIRTFQGTTLFQEMTVRDNVRIGCHRRARSSFLSRLLGTDRQSEAAADTKSLEILEFFDLRDLSSELAANLPHGYQRALGMAVALAAEPKVMLLDEPFTGMNAEETGRMMDHVRQLRAEHDMTIMLVEHDMQAVMGLCDTITVMNFGSLLAEGPPDEIRADTAVIEAYLGSADYAA